MHKIPLSPDTPESQMPQRHNWVHPVHNMHTENILDEYREVPYTSPATTTHHLQPVSRHVLITSASKAGLDTNCADKHAQEFWMNTGKSNTYIYSQQSQWLNTHSSTVITPVLSYSWTGLLNFLI